MAGRRVLPLVAVLVALLGAVLPPLVEGTHFRYGTLSWVPRLDDKTIGWTCKYGENNEGCDVEFNFKAAYRRDYQWGRFFREQWRTSTVGPQGEINTAWTDGGSCYNQTSCAYPDPGFTPVENSENYQLFPVRDAAGNRQPDRRPDAQVGATFPGSSPADVYEGLLQIRLSTGMSFYALDNNTDMFGNGENTRTVCKSPFETGDSPLCDEEEPAGTPKFPHPGRNTLAFGEPSYQYNYDPRNQTVPVKYQREYVRYNSSHEAEYDAGMIPCEKSDDTRADYCAPWSNVYGLFFGDGSFSDVILTVTEVGYPQSWDMQDTSMANYIVGESAVYKTYPRAKDTDITPWRAYFTGGNRVTKTYSNLQNNHQGRFRVECTVNLNFPAERPNRSPQMFSLPVLPVPFTGRGEESAFGIMATFQVEAFDPDIEFDVYTESGISATEFLHYFIGTAEQHGLLLANQVPDGTYPSNWYKDDYEAKRLECYMLSCGGTADDYPAKCSNCSTTVKCGQLGSDSGGSDTIANPAKLGIFSCSVYPPWDNAENLAHPPPNMMVDVYTGVVRWETGASWDVVDTDGYLEDLWMNHNPYAKLLPDSKRPDWYNTSDPFFLGNPHAKKVANASEVPSPPKDPLAWGLYNVVFDVRSQSKDVDCNKTTALTGGDCHDLANINAPEIAYVSTPLDMLVYLYPPVSFCSSSKCGGDQSATNIQTFRDLGEFTAMDDGGTTRRQCAICGGGSWPDYRNDTMAGNATLCGLFSSNNCERDADSLVPRDDALCKQNTPPYFVDPTPVVDEVKHGVTNGNETWPFPGFAEVVSKKGDVLTFPLQVRDDDDCADLQIRMLGSYTGDALYNFNYSLSPPRLNDPQGPNMFLCTQADASIRTGVPGDGANNCELNVRLAPAKPFNVQVNSSGTYLRQEVWWSPLIDNRDEYFGGTTRYSEPGYELGEFYNLSKPLPEEMDQRPSNIIQCFLPFDGYQVGKTKCFNLVLVPDKQLYWVDAREGLEESFNAADFLQPPYTPADGTVFYVAPGNTLSFIMRAIQNSGYGAVDIGISAGGVVNDMGETVPWKGATFKYVDDVQFQALGYANGKVTTVDPLVTRDPAARMFEWTPEEGDQCEYQICFLGTNNRAPIDRTVELQTNALDERCYQIFVMDQALFFDDTFINIPAALPALTDDCGMSFSMWFQKWDTGTDIHNYYAHLATFGYTMHGQPLSQATAVATLYMTKGESPRTYSDTDNGPIEFRSGKYAFGLGFDITVNGEEHTVVARGNIGEPFGWHFAMVTIDPAGKLTLYFDGATTTHLAPDLRGYHVASVQESQVTTSHLIGNILAQNPGSTGVLVLGSRPWLGPIDDYSFIGWITDVRIYSRALSADEVDAKMFTPLVPEEEFRLEAYYKFNDGDQVGNALGNPNGHFNMYLDRTGDSDRSGVQNVPLKYGGDNDNEMLGYGKTVKDSSGNGNDGLACDVSECAPVPGVQWTDHRRLHFNWMPAPTMPPCPTHTDHTVVHVDGGEDVVVYGSGFANSPWLKCSFTMSSGEKKIVPAQWDKARPNEVSCVNPGSPDLTVMEIEVTNGAEYSARRIPLYQMERFVQFPDSASSVVMKTAGNVFTYQTGAAVGAWVYPRKLTAGAVFTLNGTGGVLQVYHTGTRFVVREKGPADWVGLAQSGEALASGQGEGAGWHYVMMRRPGLGEGDDWSLYVDGEEFQGTPGQFRPTVLTDVYTDIDLVLGAPYAVGMNAELIQGFVGYVEELTVWTHPITLCQSYQLMWGNLTQEELCPSGNGKLWGPNPRLNLKAYLKFNEILENSVNPVRAFDSSQRYSQKLTVESFLAGKASHIWGTVPFLAPSFNRPRPRVGPAQRDRDASVPDYFYTSTHYGPNANAEFIATNPGSTLVENVTYPRGFQDYYEYATFLGDGVVNTALNATDQLVMAVDGSKSVRLIGFGFAESKWLKCEFDGERVPARMISPDTKPDEVVCTIPARDHPDTYSLGVMNLWDEKPDCNATVGVRPAQRGQDAQPLVAYVPDVAMKEVSLELDGVDDYAMSEDGELNGKLLEDGWKGATFGAWIWPRDTNATREQPVMCFTSACRPPFPPPPPPSPPPPSPTPCNGGENGCLTNLQPPSPPPKSPIPPPGPSPFKFVPGETDPFAQFCVMYKDETVYLHSMLIGSDESYPDLFWNSTASKSAKAKEWHYVEVTIHPNLVSPEIVSDTERGHTPMYKASINVDGQVVDGSEDGLDIRLPIHEETLKKGNFLLGGLACGPGSPTLYHKETYQGMIDEVRVFKGVHPTNWFQRLSEEERKSPDLVGYYRMTATLDIDPAPDSTELYYNKPKSYTLEDFSPNKLDLTMYELSKTAVTSYVNYTYVEAPWEAATAYMTSVDELILDADATVSVHGYNVANTSWLKCVFAGANLTDKEVTFGGATVVDAEYISSTEVKCKVPEGQLPSLGYVQIANPRANDAAAWTYLESALELEGDKVKTMDIIGGLAMGNRDKVLDLQCPVGLRVDKVLFANYGRPKNGCNAVNETACDGSDAPAPCDFLAFEVDETCDSNVGKPPFWTEDRISQYCYGKASCSIPSNDALFGDPCPEKYKWLQVALRCSDRFTTKDYLRNDDVSKAIDGGEYSVGVWVYPHSKPSVQAVAAFGGKLYDTDDATQEPLEAMNRAIIQWRGEKDGTSGIFYYYDDCVLDVTPKKMDGLDMVVAADQWYQIWLTRSADYSAKLYINGFEAASWTTACAPDPDGTFTLGMDLSDDLFPKEYFDGLLDEVKVYRRALTAEEVLASLTWSPVPAGEADLVVYYRFNSNMSSTDLGDVAKDDSGNERHGTINTAELTYVGAPWFPAATYSMQVPGGAEGPLMGGSEVTLTGLNFAKGAAQALYSGPGHDATVIPSNFVDMRTLTAIIPNLKGGEDSDDAPECVEGGEFTVSVVNVGGGVGFTEPLPFEQSLDTEDIQHGLMCYFPFLGDAADYSGNAANGVVNGATLVPNRNSYVAQAMRFSAGDSVAIDRCVGGVTVALWINYDDDELPFIHYKNLPFAAYEEETGCQTSDLDTVRNAWKHVVGVLGEDGVSIERLYVNGQESSNLKMREQAALILVNRTIGGDAFSGMIDDIWIWDRELCAAEITSLYYTEEYALEFGYGTEMEVPIASPVQGARGLLAHYTMDRDQYWDIKETLFEAAVLPFTSTQRWSVELTGYIYAPHTAEFTFDIEADDSFRLWINRGTFTLDTVGEVWESTSNGGGQDWVSVISESCPSGESCPLRNKAGKVNLAEGWYEVYMSYNQLDGGDGKDQSGNWKLQWKTTSSEIPALEVIPVKYLRAGTGPTVVEMWVWPYDVSGEHTIVSQQTSQVDGLNGMEVGILNGGFFASVYTGQECYQTRCVQYHEIKSWKSVARANTWQHLFAQYDGISWVLYIDGNKMDEHEVARELSPPRKQFFAETRAPIVFGRGNTQQVIHGAPDEVRQFYGLIHSFAKWAKAPMTKNFGPVSIDRRCPLSLKDQYYSSDENLQIYLPLNEGVGRSAYTATGKNTSATFLNGVITPAPSPRPTWVNYTCSNSPSPMYYVHGTALEQAIVGKCAVFTITAEDDCGQRRMAGGDSYTVTVNGPMHLHTELLYLTMDDGITDHNDGSYTVSFNRTIAGWYTIEVKKEGEEGGLTNKAFFHPDVAVPEMAYIHDDEDDALLTNEVVASNAGTRSQFTLQTVDKWGNLLTQGGIEEWEIFLSGPVDIQGSWTDNDDGTYLFTYDADVPGQYQMTIRMYEDKIPVCLRGRDTCEGDFRSSYDFCSLQLAPQDRADGSCRFCVTVQEGASLALSGAPQAAVVFPDSPALDLMDTPFTIQAAINKAAAPADAPASTREYIVSKQSAYSGKGYWLALLPTGSEGEYEMEAGVYVGSENFRIVRAAVQVPMGEWANVAVTYTGAALSLYVNEVAVETNEFGEEGLKWNRENAQPLRVGQGFAGLIDNVLIFKAARAPEQLTMDSLCPQTAADMDPDLVAYYRFNEGSGFMAKDASPNGNDGFLGLTCDTAPEGSNVTLQCPPAYTIAGVWSAQFGDVGGTCGRLEVEAGGCAEDYKDLVAEQCMGLERCTLRAANVSLPDSAACKGVAKTLAVNAICSPVSAGDLWGAPAPSLVGNTVVTMEELFCPMSLLNESLGFKNEQPAAPAWMRDALEGWQEADAQCGGAETLAGATAGTPVIFAVRTKDACGYKSMGGMDNFDAALTYAAEVDMEKVGEAGYVCPDLPLTDVQVDPVTVHIGSTDSNCSEWGDVYVMEVMPTRAGTPTLTLSLNGGALVEAALMPVVAGPIASTSTVTAVDNACEAGYEARFLVHGKDAFGNPRLAGGDAAAIAVTVDGAPAPFYRVAESATPGVYDLFLTFAAAGSFTVNVTVNGEEIYAGPVTCSGPLARPLDNLNITTPAARFEHTMVSYKDDLYVFGGAAADKTYLDATLKLDLAAEPSVLFFGYKRLVNVENMPDTDFNVELKLNTNAMIAEGKLRSDCADLRFFTYDGATMLPMWVEPPASPGGCNATATSVWIKVPADMSQFWLYYGNKQAAPVSDPQAVFGAGMFEDFEFEDSPLNNGWELEAEVPDECPPDALFSAGDPASFYTSEAVSLTGSRALRVDTVGKLGGSLMKAIPSMSRFTLKVFMYDMHCKGAHFVSPDYASCHALDDVALVGGKVGIPGNDTGAGIYSASTDAHYSVLYPWHSSESERSVGWHSFTFRDDDATLSITFDEGSPQERQLPLRNGDVTTDLARVLLRSAQMVEELDVESSVFWDAILVTAYDSTVQTSTADEQVVAYNPAATWTAVGTTNPPPARQAHSAVVAGDAMYIFGGERSAYEYSDVWRYDFTSDSWEFQAPANGNDALGRHDHAAAVHDGVMYVYGGRSPAPLGDFWAYDLATHEWSEMPTSEGMAPRFGHSAAVLDGRLYVYGGFVAGADGDGGLTSDIWEFAIETQQWTKLGPRLDNYDNAWTSEPTDAIQFPQQVPSERFAQSMVLAGMQPALYVVGGAGGASEMEEQGNVWKFDLATKTWTWLGAGDALARYDSAAAVSMSGTRLVLYGGSAKGDVLDSAVVFFIGDSGSA